MKITTMALIWPETTWSTADGYAPSACPRSARLDSIDRHDAAHGVEGLAYSATASGRELG